MKILKITTALLALSAVSAHAGGVSGGNADSDWTIYGWQNYSYEFVDTGDRDYQRINGNAANIGFSASIDTGFAGLSTTLQCEQFTFTNRLNGYPGNGWCNRNSKLGLKGAFGEIMVGQWLLPANEMVAQWVDPFYDAGADSHTSIMGNVGSSGWFFNGGFESSGAGTAGRQEAFGGSQAFNRRQNDLVQYFSPNINGFTFRIATTNGNEESQGDEVPVTDANGEEHKLDPRIWSTGIAYDTTLSSGDNVWGAVTYELHDEWAAVSADCSDSKDEVYRIAGRYIHNMDGGRFIKLAAMYEMLEYDWDDCAGGVQYSGTNGGGGHLSPNADGDVDLERDSWMVSGVFGFGNGFDVRGSYMDADEVESFGSDVDNSDATAFNLGLFYTMPAGTELRLTYSEINNKEQANYDFGINPVSFDGSGNGFYTMGRDLEMFALGLVQWF